MEVLAAIQHTQMTLGRDFTHEEFMKGTVGEHMICEDFDFEVTVSFIPLTYRLFSDYWTLELSLYLRYSLRNYDVRLFFTRMRLLYPNFQELLRDPEGILCALVLIRITSISNSS